MIGFLAIDIGASSGKAFVGKYDRNRLVLEEVHRFSNEPIHVAGSTHWNLISLYRNVVDSIKAASVLGIEIRSVGIDTWGVDFGLIDSSGSIQGDPRHYRDMFKDDSMDYAIKKAGKRWIFDRAPTHFQPFNTLYQLISLKRKNSRHLKKADTLLPMPSLLTYFLTGEKLTEFTFATTTQLFDPDRHDWSEELMRFFDLPEIMTPIVDPGEIAGELLPSISKELDIKGMKVILPASHDTASAVSSMDLSDDSMFVSAGTWCLEGVLIDKPSRDEDVIENNLANEGCYGRKYRLLKNLTGLWLVQELLREWRKSDPNLDHYALTEMAQTARSYERKIDVESKAFKKPKNMEKAILSETKSLGISLQNRGEIVRAAIEGIAYQTEQTRKQLQSITGRSIRNIRMVGGGIRNRLLCQLVSDYTGLPVVAGPAEGTATGNIIVQMLGLGELSDLSQAHDLIQRSFNFQEYTPKMRDFI